MKKQVKKWIILSISCFALGGMSLAVAAATSGIGGVAANIASGFQAIAKLITGASFLAGLGFMMGAILKFKAHKDNPTQIPVGTPIALLFVGAALVFIPALLKVGGVTLFGSDATSHAGKYSGISGVVN